MKPLIVTARVRSNILLGAGLLTLDALVAEAINRSDLDVCSPIATHDGTPSGVPMASAAFIYDCVPSQSTTVVRTVLSSDIEDDLMHACNKLPLNIAMGSGIYRSHIVNQYRSLFMAGGPITAQWFVVADPDSLLQILKLLPGLGKKAGVGFGSIAEDDWVIEEDEAPLHSLAIGGTAMRPVPMPVWSMLFPGVTPKSTRLERTAYPYHSGERTLCSVPSRTVFLNELDYFKSRSMM